MNEERVFSDRRVKKTKKAIQNALLTLMDRKNISDITIIELTREADVNRKTFYNHYSDIYQVMDEIEDNIVDNLNGLLVDCIAKSHVNMAQFEGSSKMTKGQEQLSKLILPFFENMINELRYNPELFKLVMYFGGHFKLIKKIVKKEKMTLIACVGSSEKSMPWMDFYLTFMMEGMLATIFLWKEMDYPVSDDEIAVFLSGITASIGTSGMALMLSLIHISEPTRP